MEKELMPWEADRELSGEGVERAVAQQFPNLEPVRASYLGSGWDNDAYLVNDQWVFRFPRRAGVQEVLRRERAILPVIAGALDVAVPRFELTGRPGPHFPYQFSAYRRLPGVPGEQMEVPAGGRSGLAKQIGRFLSQLHAIEPASMPGGEPLEAVRSPADCLAEAMSLAEDFRTAVGESLSRRYAPWLRGEVAPPPGYAGPPRVVHNDLGESHLLLDSQTHRLTGVIDWADASVGDPCVDFIFAPLWFGWDFLEQVLTHYELPVDPGFLERLRFDAVAVAMIYAAESWRMDEPDQVRRWREWLAAQRSALT